MSNYTTAKHISGKPAIYSASAPLWELAFRPFFLLASAVSVFALAAWVGILNSWSLWLPVFSPVLWHIHEMIFGFALTIAAAFLLTAVQTWTGLRSLHGKSLMLLVVIWLLIRLLIWQPWWAVNNVLMLAVLLLQTSWWLIVIGCFSRLLIRADNRRNYFLIPLLLIIACLNLLFIYLSYGGFFNEALHVGRSVILFFGVVIAVISGRVIPMFTRNGCRMAGVETDIKPTPRLDQVLVLLSFIAASSYLLSGWIREISDLGIEWLLFLVAILHIYRQSHWQALKTFYIPLLWSLHLSYCFLALGLIAVFISEVSPIIRSGDAFHLITVGALGGMILAMIARVSLGHTGRPLVASRLISIAFALIFMAALIRFLFPMFQLALWGWNLSVMCWGIAFSLFCYVYFPILTKDRV